VKYRRRTKGLVALHSNQQLAATALVALWVDLNYCSLDVSFFSLPRKDTVTGAERFDPNTFCRTLCADSTNYIE
jgi:hypothetical protein